jgi:deoxyribodipyrimidine photo-lyase
LEKSGKGVALLSRPEINIVWLKRDLRSQDHEPLAAAEAAGIPYLILYLFEPTLLAHPQCSLRHNQFIFGSLQDLKKTLAVQGRTLGICYADAVVVFSEILQKYSIKKLFSYRESGVQLSWDRDKEVAQLCLQNNIEWLEFQREGVLRGIQNRDGWDKTWYVKMHSPMINNSFDPNLALDWKHEFQIPETLKQAWSVYPTAYQAPGETMGWKYLKSFCEERGRNYMRQISKPLGSRYSCGRVSPYLAWGCLSVKQVYQYVKNNPNAANN